MLFYTVSYVCGIYKMVGVWRVKEHHVCTPHCRYDIDSHMSMTLYLSLSVYGFSPLSYTRHPDS